MCKPSASYLVFNYRATKNKLPEKLEACIISTYAVEIDSTCIFQQI